MPAEYKPNILVVCGRNKRRSRTAEFLYKNDDRLHIRSAGISEKSDHKVNEKDIRWANLILVMEYEQRVRIKEIFDGMKIPPIQVLSIPDEYEYLDPGLILLLTKSIDPILENSHPK